MISDSERVAHFDHATTDFGNQIGFYGGQKCALAANCELNGLRLHGDDLDARDRTLGRDLGSVWFEYDERCSDNCSDEKNEYWEDGFHGKIVVGDALRVLQSPFMLE